MAHFFCNYLILQLSYYLLSVKPSDLFFCLLLLGINTYEFRFLKTMHLLREQNPDNRRARDTPGILQLGGGNTHPDFLYAGTIDVTALKYFQASLW